MNPQQTTGLVSTSDSDSRGGGAEDDIPWNREWLVQARSARNEEIVPGSGGSALHARQRPGDGDTDGENRREEAGLLAWSAWNWICGRRSGAETHEQ